MRVAADSLPLGVAYANIDHHSFKLAADVLDEVFSPVRYRVSILAHTRSAPELLASWQKNWMMAFPTTLGLQVTCPRHCTCNTPLTPRVSSLTPTSPTRQWAHTAFSPLARTEPCVPWVTATPEELVIATMIDLVVHVQHFRRAHPAVEVLDTSLEEISAPAGARRLLRRLGLSARGHDLAEAQSAAACMGMKAPASALPLIVSAAFPSRPLCGC